MVHLKDYVHLMLSIHIFVFIERRIKLIVMCVYRYVFSAPSHILDDIPGTLMLTDCLEQCQANDTCRAVNYETGLCVLFSSDADQLPGEYRLYKVYYD